MGLCTVRNLVGLLRGSGLGRPRLSLCVCWGMKQNPSPDRRARTSDVGEASQRPLFLGPHTGGTGEDGEEGGTLRSHLWGRRNIEDAEDWIMARRACLVRSRSIATQTDSFLLRKAERLGSHYS